MRCGKGKAGLENRLSWRYRNLEVRRGVQRMPQVELTDRFVQGAAPDAGERQTDFYDAGAKGLILRVSSTARSFAFLFTAPGDSKRARVTFGEYPAISLAKARTLVRECRKHLAEGRD